MDIYLKENEKINIYSDETTEFKGEISINNGILKIMTKDDETKNNEININDEVKVTDTGETYPGYFEWAKKYVPNGYFWAGGKPEKNIFYTVVCKSLYNDNSDNMLYGISDIYNEVYIISGRGIKKCY